MREASWTSSSKVATNGAVSDGETIKGGTVNPGPTPFQVGKLKGNVYRYVVWDTCPASLCQDGRHLKRAVVAVRLDQTASGGVRPGGRDAQRPDPAQRGGVELEADFLADDGAAGQDNDAVAGLAGRNHHCVAGGDLQQTTGADRRGAD